MHNILKYHIFRYSSHTHYKLKNYDTHNLGTHSKRNIAIQSINKKLQPIDIIKNITSNTRYNLLNFDSEINSSLLQYIKG